MQGMLQTSPVCCCLHSYGFLQLHFVLYLMLPGVYALPLYAYKGGCIILCGRSNKPWLAARHLLVTAGRRTVVVYCGRCPFLVAANPNLFLHDFFCLVHRTLGLVSIVAGSVWLPLACERHTAAVCSCVEGTAVSGSQPLQLLQVVADCGNGWFLMAGRPSMRWHDSVAGWQS